jgi:hypothetical protein
VFELQVDTSVRRQQFITDCEVCCRPLEVRVESEAGEVVEVNVAAG